MSQLSWTQAHENSMLLKRSMCEMLEETPYFKLRRKIRRKANRLQSSENLDVDIIIGNDYYGVLITAKITKTANDALIAMESIFGWLLSGPIQNENTHATNNDSVKGSKSCQ